MLSVKESALKIIKNLPDDCSIEDIQYELYVKQKIENGLIDINNENFLSEEELEEEIKAWQK